MGSITEWSNENNKFTQDIKMRISSIYEKDIQKRLGYGFIICGKEEEQSKISSDSFKSLLKGKLIRNK